MEQLFQVVVKDGKLNLEVLKEELGAFKEVDKEKVESQKIIDIFIEIYLLIITHTEDEYYEVNIPDFELELGNL